MENRTIIATHSQSAFARHARKLGLCVMGMEEAPARWEQCEAVYWEMQAMRNIVDHNRMMGILLKVPKECVRIQDFSMRELGPADKDVVRRSLVQCNLLKIEERELSPLCHLLGLSSQSVFDCCFDLMAAFNIQTLILIHGKHGCHVFQGNVVSEKIGHISFGNCTIEEAEGAFTAAYYAASCEKGKLFTEYHRKALEYLEHVCKSR
ncbi:MAG: hypothetical protein IJ551_08955 [Prevotella sp.]|nr:hypothetical protein [Prevotella sp.]